MEISPAKRSWNKAPAIFVGAMFKVTGLGQDTFDIMVDGMAKGGGRPNKDLALLLHHFLHPSCPVRVFSISFPLGYENKF